MSNGSISLKSILIFLCILLVHFVSASEFRGLDNRNKVTEITTWQFSANESPVTLPVYLPDSLESIEIFHVFQIPDSMKGRKIRLWLPGFTGSLTILLNDHLLSTPERLISPAFLDIPLTFVRPRSINRLDLKLERPPESRTTPVHQFRQQNIISIPGGIGFEWKPAISLGDFRYDFREGELTYRFKIEINLNDLLILNENKKIRYVEEVFSPDGKSIFNRFEYIDYRAGIKQVDRKIPLTRPALWTPETPSRYRVRLKVYDANGLLDQTEYMIGLRNLTVSNHLILLNDQPIRIQGITYRERPARSESHDAFFQRLLQDFRFIKAAGLNAIRFPQSIPHPFVFQLADSLGLLLFPELDLWRQPESFFIDEQNLTAYKFNLRQAAGMLKQYSSLAALGLGHELPVHSVKVQKFIIIAREFLKQEYDLLTYLSPLDAGVFPTTLLCDFYMVNKYDAAILRPLSSYIQSQILNDHVLIIGNAGIAWSDSGHQMVQFRDVLGHLNSQHQLDGYFIESFRDWRGITASPVILRDGRNDLIYSYGLQTPDGKLRLSSEQLNQYLSQKSPLKYQSIHEPRSNVFTVTTFIAAILFFLIYRSNFRLRDNLKRSLMHSHGFFVDLRDRRIIALLNSAIVGLFTNLQISVIITAFFYYFRNDLLVAEAFTTILTPLDLYPAFYELTTQPFFLVFIIWILFYFGQVTIAVVLRLSNFFSREHIHFRQSIAICHWAGAPLIFLLPVSLFSMQIVAIDKFRFILLGILMLSFLWFNIRLATGIRVLMVIKAWKVFSLLILTYCFTVFIFFAFLDGRKDIFEYLILLTRAGNLF